MSLTVRFAQTGDETTIATLLVAIHAQHAEGRPDLFGKGSAKYGEKEVLSLFDHAEQPILVAEEDGCVLGYAICKLSENKNPAQGSYTTLYIDDLNVSAAARRKGVGTALLDACRSLAAERGCYNVTLNVWAFNEGAIAFYEKNGFSTQRMILESIL